MSQPIKVRQAKGGVRWTVSCKVCRRSESFADKDAAFKVGALHRRSAEHRDNVSAVRAADEFLDKVLGGE